MRFFICDVLECTSCGESRIKPFKKGDGLVLRLAGNWVEEKRLYGVFVWSLSERALDLPQSFVLQLFLVCAV